MKDDEFALRFTGYRIISRPYRTVAAIMAEFDPSKANLRDALRIGHGIDITDAIAECAVLHIVIDQEMAEKLKQYRIPNPTLLQLIGTSRVISLSEKDAVARFEAMMKGEN
jgi:hypothetical protein